MANDIELSRAVLSATEITNSYSDKLNKDQLEILPLVAYGMSISKIAKTIGLPEAKIRRWVNNDPIFRQAVMDFSQVKEDYNKMMLDQASVFAWSTVFEVLGDIADPKIRADMAKFIITQLSLKTEKKEIKHQVEPQLNVTENSAGLIAEKLKQLQDGADIIDSEYRITVEEETGDKSVGMNTAKGVTEFYGDSFDAEFEEIGNENKSQYIMHPECTHGELSYNEHTKKFRCHMCGQWTKDLVVHIRTEHKLSPARYRNMYGLADDTKFYVEEPEEATQEDVEEFNKELK